MARLYVQPDKLQGERLTLEEAARRHLIKVLRLGPGATVQLFDGLGNEVDARIVAVGRTSLEVTLGQQRRIAAPACAITLLQSVPRGERMDLIVQKATELGVARVVPVLTEHGMAKPKSGREQRWQAIAQEAARQSGRADVPEVAAVVPLDLALGQLAGPAEDRFLLWERERSTSLHAALAHGPRRIAVLVGPEGGFTGAEVTASRQAGFQPVSLGAFVLRAETAAIVAVALAQAAAGGLG